MLKTVQRKRKKIYAIEKVPEEESPTEDSDTDSMEDAIREQSDEEKDQREEFLVEYQEETPLEIQDIQLEAGMPQGTANKNLCKHTQDTQTFLVTPTKGMAYIHGTATKIIVCIDNAQHPLIIDSGAHFSIVARNYLDNHLSSWENQLLPTKAKDFKSASGKMTSIGTTIKEIIISHKKGDIRLNPDLVVLYDAHIQGFLLGTDYQRMYGCNNHSPGVKVFINIPTQTPQISRSTICIRVQFQKSSLLKHTYSLVHQYSLSILVQVGITQYSLDTPIPNCMITQYHHSSCTGPVLDRLNSIIQSSHENSLSGSRLVIFTYTSPSFSPLGIFP
ncbi:hypothetical protein O181_030925 [Austropuccinia psidii MF-1]|uniref:Uncharacterized protein n=1 Tax=Austropuccinia psidii MF-1 TaxID=1389203 RepID=A0A9Q3CY35_9BASI|nr:hypothetical protein [Austropuccinia psidii MF-1]